MSLPLVSCNLVGAHASAITDLGLAASLASSATSTSINVNTGVPATVLLLVKMSSGGATAALAAGSGTTPSFTGAQTVSSTNRIYVVGTTTTANPYITAQLIDSGSSCAFAELTMIILYELTPGENWHSIRSGVNAVSSLVRGDGAGNFSVTPQ